MNTFIVNSKAALSLLTLASLTLFVSFAFPDEFIFFSSAAATQPILKTLGVLPLFAATLLVLLPVFRDRLLFKVVTYVIFFVTLTGNLPIAIGLLVGSGILYWGERTSRNLSASSSSLLFLGVLGLYIPVFIYLWQVPLQSWSRYVLLLFKTCLMMRTFSWIVDRRVYKRRQFSSVLEFFEFLFCPIFFVFPGQIQYFLFNYFHESKKEFSGSAPRNLLMGIWGLVAILLFGFASTYFWREMYSWPVKVERRFLPLLHLGFGFYWLVIIYLQQVGGMAFQVCVARFLGYQIKYDMHFPLLARTPLDYLRRHSSYVRDYIVEVAVRPLSLPLLRWGGSALWVFPFVSILGYAFLIFPQTGYRVDYERPVASSLVLIGFLSVYILLPLVTSAGRDHLARPVKEKALRDWTGRDYLAWLGTLILVAMSKSALGLALAYFGTH